MKIGEVSKRTGLPASTIRYYEKVGLMKFQPRISGRRDFDDQAMFVLKFVRLAQSAGFSIEEIKSLIEAYQQSSKSTGVWLDMVQRKRSQIRSKMAELSQMEAILTELLSCKCASLDQCIETGFARIEADKDASG